MIDIATASAFFIASSILALTPGPDNLFVLAQSVTYGKRAGFTIISGLCSGVMVHTLAVALGITALLKTVPSAFTTLKIIGAVYLVFLAWKEFSTNCSKGRGTHSSLPATKLFKRGIVMNLTNPKVALFFLAFLPQFASESNGSIPLQIVSLGLIFIVSTWIVFGAIAWFSSTFGEWLTTSPVRQQWLHRFTGTVFVGLAVRILIP